MIKERYFQSLSVIRPLLEYGNTVWDNCSQQLKADIEHIQIEAARMVSGATKLCNIEHLPTDLNWETLAERRRQYKLIKFYKMKNYLTAYMYYLSSIIPLNPVRTSPLGTQQKFLSFKQIFSGKHCRFNPPLSETGIH